MTDELASVDPDKQVAHTKGDVELEYDRLVLALGAKAVPRYQHAVTIDAAHMDEGLHMGRAAGGRRRPFFFPPLFFFFFLGRAVADVCGV